MWTIRLGSSAEKELKKIRKSPKFNLFEKVIHVLERSDDPRRLGVFKKGNLRCLSYEVTASFRILDDIDYANRLIIIRGIGTHKQVYGKD